MSQTQVYTGTQITDQFTGDLSAWSLADDGMIQRTYQTGSWPYSMLVAGGIALLAEAACHHPDLLVTFPSVTVKLTSHDAGGVTDKDFELARLIEKQVLWLPSRDSALDGFEKGFGKDWIR